MNQLRPRKSPWGAIAVVMLLAGCGGDRAGSLVDTAEGMASRPGATSSASAQPDGSSGNAAAESPTVVCPNPHGGACLGELAQGTYTTKLFATQLSYTVADGWANLEDLPGNVLLVPPTASAEGVDAGTADYVGLYDGIAVASADCFERPQSDVDTTPAAMAAWFVAHPGLDTTDPTAVSVGGLDGLVLDLRLADDYTGTCPYAQPEGTPLLPMIIGARPAEVHHVMCCDIATRLYLLAGQAGRVLAIELSDVPGGADLEGLDAVVDDFVFSTEG